VQQASESSGFLVLSVQSERKTAFIGLLLDRFTGELSDLDSNTWSCQAHTNELLLGFFFSLFSGKIQTIQRYHVTQINRPFMMIPITFLKITSTTDHPWKKKKCSLLLQLTKITKQYTSASWQLAHHERSRLSASDPYNISEGVSNSLETTTCSFIQQYTFRSIYSGGAPSEGYTVAPALGQSKLDVRPSRPIKTHYWTLHEE